MLGIYSCMCPHVLSCNSTPFSLLSISLNNNSILLVSRSEFLEQQYLSFISIIQPYLLSLPNGYWLSWNIITMKSFTNTIANKFVLESGLVKDDMTKIPESIRSNQHHWDYSSIQCNKIKTSTNIASLGSQNQLVQPSITGITQVYTLTT